MASASKKKADLKVVLIGESEVGKTSFVMRYIHGTFSSSIGRTLGAAFFIKQWGSHNVAVWDTAGEEKFASLGAFYCRDAGAAIVAYDITDRDSFNALRTRFINQLPADNCLKVIVGTKLDLVTEETRQVSREEGQALALEVNHALIQERGLKTPFYETSSKSNEGVSEAFEFIFTNCLGPHIEKFRPERRPESIQLRDTTGIPHQTSANHKPCC